MQSLSADLFLRLGLPSTVKRSRKMIFRSENVLQTGMRNLQTPAFQKLYRHENHIIFLTKFKHISNTTGNF